MDKRTAPTFSEHIYNEFYSKIDFFEPLNLYNKDGQIVGNTIGASYNPCTPTTTWSAPACHFFAP
jgi:hypothetical protein